MPQLSVIVPVYKAEQYLSACVESILGQSFSDLELILVDDGSPDGSPALCDQLARQDGRVKVIHQENAGAAAARDRGIEAAGGEYITFVDSDDYIDGDMYEKMMETAHTHMCDLVICDCCKEWPDRRELYSHSLPGGYYDRARMEEVYFPQLLMTASVEYPVTISNCLLLIRRSLVEREHIRYPHGIRFSEDLLFGAEVGYAAEKIYYQKGWAPYHYRQNPDSVTHTTYRNKWPMLLDLHDRIARSFERKRDFDFRPQIDRCLLFFVYLAMGEIQGADLPERERGRRIREVLDHPSVRQMMGRISISELEISWKLKVMTYLYRWRALPLLRLARRYMQARQQ